MVVKTFCDHCGKIIANPRFDKEYDRVILYSELTSISVGHTPHSQKELEGNIKCEFSQNVFHKSVRAAPIDNTNPEDYPEPYE